MKQTYPDDETPYESRDMPSYDGGDGDGDEEEPDISPTDDITTDDPDENDSYYGDFKDHADRDRNEPIQWAKLKLGKTVLCVCSTGIVRRDKDPFYHVSSGVTLTGSPYRFIVVETDTNVFEKFFMHDIVWKAFHGNPPMHWEVRHKPWVPMEHTRDYPNDLHCLEVYPKITAPFNGW